jgi:uroporphyrinogen decarboxylase
MTGRERVLAALTGKTADRLPVDVGATEFTGIAAGAYAPLKKLLGVEGGKTRVMDPFCGNVRVERTVCERLRVDATGLFVGPRRWRSGKLHDGSTCLLPERWLPETGAGGEEIVRHPIGEFTLVRKPGETCFSYESDHPPLADCRTADDVAKRLQSIAVFDWPYHADEIASEFGVGARAKREETSAALVVNCRARVIGGARVLRGEEIFRDMEERPEVADAILGRLTDAYVARLTDLLPEAAPHADVVCVAEGPSDRLTLEQYRAFFRPHHERLYTHIKKTSGLPLVVFTKGLPAEIIRELIELGVDGIGFVSFPSTATPAEVREVAGEDVALWGVGAGSAFLKEGRPETMGAEVERLVESAGGLRGLVFALSEPVPAGALSENVVAVVEAARELGT